MDQTRAASLALAALISCCALAAAQTQNITQVYDRPLASFESREQPAIKAIADLGFQSKAPLGMILADEGLCETEVGIDSHDQTPRQFLATLTGQVSGYRRGPGGILVIKPDNMPSDAVSLLKLMIPRYAALAGPIEGQLAELSMQISGVLHPGEGMLGETLMTIPTHPFPAIEVRILVKADYSTNL